MELIKREISHLKIKIGEAKNLAGRSANSSGANRDVYCTIALDQEEICRTQTQRNQSPFFGEEFSFEIPRKFRYLSVYVLERDRHLKQDKAIRKIAIRRRDLYLYNHKENWFELREVNDDSEVQGMAHIEVKVLSDPQDDDHSKENFKSTSNNYTTTTILSSSSSAANQGTANHKSPKLLHSTSGSITQRSSSQQDVSIIHNNNMNHQHHHLNNHHQNGNFLRVPYTNSHHQNQRIQVKLKACSDLTKKNNQCDPYAIITAIYTNKRKITRRTKVRKKTIHPQFDDVFEFNLYDFTHGTGSHGTSDSKIYTVTPFGGNDLCEIIVSLWHSVGGMADDNFLGEIRLPARGRQELQYIQQSAWYFLMPRATDSRPVKSCATPPGTRLSYENSLGSLRIKLHYQSDHVFPLANYDHLLNLLIQSIDQRPITTSAVYLLGEMVANKQEIAQPLVRLFTHNNRIVDIIQRLAEWEICKLTDPTTIFRGNTLVSKMMDEAMKLSGLHYLHSTLRPIVELILHEKKCCEIDPARIKEKMSVEQNLNNLHDYVEKVFDAIIKSAPKCPQVLCEIFHNMRESATKIFPANKEVRYSVVSGFIFLRFFAPAILGPKLFDLTTEPLDIQTNRTLTLISKTIQSLGNLVSSRSAQQHAKEEFTVELYKKFCTEKHVNAAKKFLDAISSMDTRDCESCGTEPILLKDGMMTKHAQNRKRFGRRNFKQRYFKLTTQSLSYAKAKNSRRVICDIPLTEIVAVEKMEDRNFKMQNIFRIVKKDRPIYIQTANCVEEKEWMDLLNKICDNNKRRLETFHPSAFIKGEWTCCKETDQYAKGCKSPEDEPLELDLVTQLDPARDLQRLHSLIISIMNVVQKFFDQNMGNGEEMQLTRQTLQKLSEVALQLEQIHRKHKIKEGKDVKVGSKQEPIGDDNYLRSISLNSGASTTPRTTAPTQHFELPPTLCFQRGLFLRSSDSERFSHF